MKYSSYMPATKEFKAQVGVNFFLFNIVKGDGFENCLRKL